MCYSTPATQLSPPVPPSPGLHRQVVYGGLRIGLYDPVKAFYQERLDCRTDGNPSLLTKIVAGITTGAIAITVANPTDLVKVRMQAEGKLAPGVAKKYPSAFKAYGIIAKQEGPKALWTGWGPNVARNSIINAAELASYDQFKEMLGAIGLTVRWLSGREVCITVHVSHEPTSLG